MAIDDDKDEKDRAKLERELKQIEHDLHKVVRKSKSERYKRMEARMQRAELAALEMAAELGAARAKVEGDCDRTHTTASTWPESTISRYSRVSMVSSDGRWIVPKPDGSIASESRRNSGISVDSRWKELSKPSNASRNSKQIRRRTERSSLESQFNLDMEQTESSKQVRDLLLTVGTLVSDEDKRKRLMNHWQYKSTRLSMQCLGYEGNWDEEVKAIHDLDNWRRIQDERITSVQRGQPNLQSEQTIKFAKRAALDPTFRITLDRVAKEATCINEQIREEAKVEIMALEECLAMDQEELRPKRELVAMKAILEFTEDEVDVYRISCETCRDDQINFVGPIETDLKAAVDKHIDQVAKLVSTPQGKGVLYIFNRSKAKGKTSPAPTAQPSQASSTQKSKSKNDAPHRHEAWSKDFAQHVSQHVKPRSRFKSISQSDVIEFCRENLKVEVLQRQPEGNLYWHQPSL